MITRIILVNGPPRSGKDTLAYAVSRDSWFADFDVRIERFAGILKDNVHRILGYPYDEARKDMVMPASKTNKTHRQAYISFSEDFMKPMFGNDIFGELLKSKIADMKPKEGKDMLVVIPDSGFYHEAIPINRYFGSDNVHVMSVYRPGFDFTGDSRSYWPIDQNIPDDEFTPIHNEEGRDKFIYKSVRVVADIVTKRGWWPGNEKSKRVEG